MSDVFDLRSLQDMMAETLQAALNTISAAAPRLLAGLLLVVAGFALAKLMELLTRGLLRRLGLDQLIGRLGVGPALARSGLSRPSTVASKIGFWAVFLFFLLLAIDAAGMGAARGAVARLTSFLPAALGAGVILLIGSLLARFARSAIGSGGVVAELPAARRLAAAAYFAVLLVAFILALEQLGLETSLLVAGLVTLLAVVGLTFGAAFALGAAPVVTHILAGHYLRQTLPDRGEIEILGRRGSLERVGAVDTLLRDDRGRSFSVPNGRLLEEVLS